MSNGEKSLATQYHYREGKICILLTIHLPPPLSLNFVRDIKFYSNVAFCSSAGCIGYIRLFCVADTILLLYTVLCLCRTYCMLLLTLTYQWTVCLHR